MGRLGIGYMGAVVAVMACLPASALSACHETDPTAGNPWLNGRFVYEFSPGVAEDASMAATFESACKLLLSGSALQCTPRAAAPEDTDYVYVVDGAHDFSFVGRQGGCQLLSILSWHNPMVVAHEIKHALGWAHEQQHPDRDRYIDVFPDAIPAQYQAEFQVRELGNEGPYDFDSIMHLYPSDLAQPGEYAFRPKPAFAESAPYVGQRDHLSETDLAEIREFYSEVLVE